jgi:hypothetical protein
MQARKVIALVASGLVYTTPSLANDCISQIDPNRGSVSEALSCLKVEVDKLRSKGVAAPAAPDARLYTINLPWRRTADRNIILKRDDNSTTHESIAIFQLVVSTKLSSGAIEVIPRVSSLDPDACPRVRIQQSGPVYVLAQCIVSLKAGTHTYSVFINPDTEPQPDDATPSLVRGSILIYDVRLGSQQK